MIRSEGCKPPILVSRSRKPGRDARQLSVALERLGRHINGDGERLGETLESAVVAAGLGEFIELALGVLDLRPRREIHRRLIGDIDHVFADPDQVAPQRQIIDRAPVIVRVDDGGGFRGEAGKVLADRHAADIGLGGQEGLQRHRGRDLAHPDQAAGGLVDGLMDRLVEVFRLQKVRHAVEGVVVDQDRAQQALFRLDIVRCAAKRGGSGIGRELEDVRISQGHGRGYSADLVVVGIFGSGAAIKRQSPGRRKREAALCTIHTCEAWNLAAAAHSRLTGLGRNRAAAGAMRQRKSGSEVNLIARGKYLSDGR